MKELQKSVWLSGPEFLRQNKLVLPTDEGQTEGQHILLTRSVAPEKSYFKNKSRHATEDITNGVAWSLAVAAIPKSKTEFTSDPETKLSEIQAEAELQRKMQTEAWLKGLDSIHKLPPREKKAILAMSPFVDPTDQLIKQGGQRLPQLKV